MSVRRFATAALAAAVISLSAGAAATSAPGEVPTTGNPVGPFSQNKQNEPAVAIDAHQPSALPTAHQQEHPPPRQVTRSVTPGGPPGPRFARASSGGQRT